MNTWRVMTGDVRERLAELPDASARCCVTSPPYWGLRDYGVAGQIGREDSIDEHMEALVSVFREVRRVLTDDGTIWVNYGDAYNAGTSAKRKAPRTNVDVGGWGDAEIDGGARMNAKGLKTKDLIGLPWMLAFALRADGWYLRSDIIWSKPNPMPESVTDRPTKAHEYIFLLSKSKSYYYDAAAIREMPSREWWSEARTEPGNPDRRDGGGITARPSKTDKQRGHGRRHAGFNDRWDGMERAEQMQNGANKRSVWNVATSPYPDAHFATFPEKLIEPCILAGSAFGDTVLDPFTGSGTTGAVAIRHQRNFIGTELNTEYVELARKRIAAVAPMFAQEVA